MENERPYTQGNVKIVDIAKRLNIPARYLSEVVNQKFGYSFPKYLNSYRVQEAKKLLSMSDELPITEVMLNAGFSTKSSFNSEFKRIVGVSPSVYRKNYSLE